MERTEDHLFEPEEQQQDDEDTTRNKFLTFVVGREEFGLEIYHVEEIISMVDVRITRVPSTPEYVKGIINLRGDIIPVVDVRTRFGIEPKEYDDLTCIVVIRQKDYNIGLIVDFVKEVRLIDEENIAPPPNAKLDYTNLYIKNLGKADERVVLLIDLQKLLFDE